MTLWYYLIVSELGCMIGIKLMWHTWKAQVHLPLTMPLVASFQKPFETFWIQSLWRVFRDSEVYNEID